MADYLTYEVEDFVVDDFFIAWVLDEDEHAKHFWERWMEEHPHQRAAIMHAYSIVQGVQVSPQGYLSDAEIEEIHQKVVKRIALHRGDSGFRYLLMTSKRWLSVAAVILLVLAAGAIVYFKSQPARLANLKNDKNALFVLRQNKGTRPVLVYLPDRSSIVLKPGSSLRYSSSFSGKSREVMLKGEAFFEIKNNKLKPFIVHTDELSTLVLGTSFTVRDFEGENDCQVVVSSGKVAVSRTVKYQGGNGAKAVTLVADEALVYDRKDTAFSKQKLSSPPLISPEVSKKLFKFHNEPFARVIQKLEDVYGVEILFDKNTIGKCSISASLSDQSLYEKVEMICDAVNAKFKVNETNITITGEGCNGNSQKIITNP